MTNVFAFIGLWASAIMAISVLGITTYLLAFVGAELVVKRLAKTYQWVSVLHYMGVCLKHGRAGLLKEVEDAKKEQTDSVH